MSKTDRPYLFEVPREPAEATPHDRAFAVMAAFETGKGLLSDLIAQAIQIAVEQEREACAELCDRKAQALVDKHSGTTHTPSIHQCAAFSEAAEAIRERDE